MTKTALRGLFLTLGVLCVVLGFVGAFVPVLPTTPFLLVAVWAFSKSSPRLRQWLLDHPRYGPPLRDFAEDGVIPRPVKWVALPVMFFSVWIVYLLAPSPFWVVLHATLVLATAAYIASRPSVRVITVMD